MSKSLDWLDTATDEEYLEVAEKVKGKTDKFQEVADADFSYSTFANHLKGRGFVWKGGKKDGEWIKDVPSDDGIETIYINQDAGRARFNLNVSRDVKELYEEFLKDKSFPFVHTSAALLLYMKACADQRVSAVLGLTTQIVEGAHPAVIRCSPEELVSDLKKFLNLEAEDDTMK